MIVFIDKAHIRNKRVILRVDFNVAIKKKKILDDLRIRQTIPTILKLLKDRNKIIIVSHLGRPTSWDNDLKLRPVAEKLHDYLPRTKITVIDDFMSEGGARLLSEQKEGEILFLENIRFFEGEAKPSSQAGQALAQNLAGIADVFVNDAFGVSHRECVSITELPKLMPSYGGLLLEREIVTISHLLKHPKHPFVAVVGGAKISTKLQLLHRIAKIADVLLLGGGLANTLLLALKYPIGRSLAEKNVLDEVKNIVRVARDNNTKIMLPVDVVVGDENDTMEGGQVKKIAEVGDNDKILDIGPETQALFEKVILSAKTIIWNGPVGLMENPQYARGTDFMYYAITQNTDAVSVVGGGDTLAALKKKEYIERISHISTGGGAMLEYIEKGTLPGIEALK